MVFQEFRNLFCVVLAVTMVDGVVWAQDAAARKAEYVRAVTRGAGWLPWQERGASAAETEFRAEIEARKTEILSQRGLSDKPVMLTEEMLSQARKNIEATDWGRQWFENLRSFSDELAGYPESWVEEMLLALSPAHGYGFTCPKCVGRLSQEAAGQSQVVWNYREPEVLTCRSCGQRYPDAAYPETGVLELPRSGQTITYYLNDAERAQPENRTGELAWHWVGYPIHVSFSGLIREQKVSFMRTAARTLGLAHALTGDLRYAARAKAILLRLAQCYRHWCHRDYWDTYADCDPMYAAWHDQALPLEWKRHLSEQAFAKDEPGRASMRQNYWGAGRVHPSTDAISSLPNDLLAYDCVRFTRRENGEPLWGAEERAQVERDYFLEYIMGAEPYVGGAGHADNPNNKSPRIYNAMAALGKCLGLPAYADTALRGYEKVRDESFLGDGFSTESPAYTNMYLSQLLEVPETLHGFVWPEGFAGRRGVADLYASDAKLGRMYASVLQTLCPDGSYLPLSDTQVGARPDPDIVLKGLRRYPDIFSGTIPWLCANPGGEYALFNLPAASLREDGAIRLGDNLYPEWQTALMRHGDAVAALAFNPAGGHRHYDNLALYYASGGVNVLGEQGYLCDMPLNGWIHSTQSHNLVVVDHKEQDFAGRDPEFGFMASSPLATVVEAASNAYAQCGEYRRRVVMLKGPEGRTLLVDIFRVAGGQRHAYRVYSELASSTGEAGALAFGGVAMPAEAPLPQVGGSLEKADIFGLRDVRVAVPGEAVWSATWRERDRAFRMWMLSPCGRVEAGNGPGQRTLSEPGRRVRYVDAVRENEAESVFVAVHEPGLPGDAWVVAQARMLTLPEQAGARGVGVELDTAWGRYVVLSDIAGPVAAGHRDFAGDFALFHYDSAGVAREFTCGEQTEGRPGWWQGEAQRQDDATFVAGGLEGYEPCAGVDLFVGVKTATGWTGYPVVSAGADTITVGRYPLPDISAYRLPRVVWKP